MYPCVCIINIETRHDLLMFADFNTGAEFAALFKSGGELT